jgi:hypothetical protein
MPFGLFTLSPTDVHTVILGVYSCAVFATLAFATRSTWARRKAIGRFIWPDPEAQLRRVIGALVVTLVAALAMQTLPLATRPE